MGLSMTTVSRVVVSTATVSYVIVTSSVSKQKLNHDIAVFSF